jgi:hypothetical protein
MLFLAVVCIMVCRLVSLVFMPLALLWSIGILWTVEVEYTLKTWLAAFAFIVLVRIVTSNEDWNKKAQTLLAELKKE